MRVLITGDTGFVGSYIKDYYLKRGHEVVGVHRRPISRRKNISNYIEMISDISDPSQIENITKRAEPVDIVIHNAAVLSGTDYDLIKANCLGTANVARLCLQILPEKAVYVSSVPIIGNPCATPFDETHFENPESVYLATKLEGEKLFNVICGDISHIIIRVPSPIGTGMHKNTFPYIVIKKLLNGDDVEVYGHGMRIQNYIDVRDVAKAIYDSAASMAEGMYLLGGNSISNMDFVMKAKETLKSSSVIKSGNHIDPEEDLKWIYSVRKAEDDWGFECKCTLDDSIKAIADWIRAS